MQWTTTINTDFPRFIVVFCCKSSNGLC